jgi:hypothetical protein
VLSLPNDRYIHRYIVHVGAGMCTNFHANVTFSYVIYSSYYLHTTLGAYCTYVCMYVYVVAAVAIIVSNDNGWKLPVNFAVY